MEKHIVEGKARTSDRRLFTIEKVEASEENVLLDFGESIDHEVVKLSIAGLPSEDEGGKKITWINNFGIRHHGSDRYVERVDYTVFLPARANARFVYYESGTLKKDKTPGSRGSKPERPGMVQVDFTTGDPAAGWG